MDSPDATEEIHHKMNHIEYAKIITKIGLTIDELIFAIQTLDDLREEEMVEVLPPVVAKPTIQPITIQQGSIGKKQYRSRRKSLYPIASMKVNDFIELAGEDGCDKLRSSAWTFIKNEGWKFRTRSIWDDKTNKVIAGRLYRTK